MKKLRDRVTEAGIYLLLIASGYILSRCFEIPNFEFSKTVDISNYINLILTAWMAILISNVFDKQKNDRRVEKELIITRIGGIYDVVESLQLEANRGSIHITEVSSSVKRITTSLTSIYRIVDKCHFNIGDDLKNRLKNNLANIRDTLTKTPSVTDEQQYSNDSPIEIKDSMVYYDKNHISQLEVKFETLKNLLFELQIHINNE